MKKKIEIVEVDSSLLTRMNEKLKICPNSLIYRDELKIALTNMLDGLSESVILELADDQNHLINKNQIKAGDLVISVNSRKVTRDNEEIILTPKEFDILYFLARNRGEVFTKEQIYKAVREENYLLDDSNIMAFIRKLRKKIEPNPDNPKYIITIWGIGYKFTDKL